MKTILIKDLLGTKYPTSHEQGKQVYDAVKAEIDAGNSVILDFEGLKVCTSHLWGPGIGGLYDTFGEGLTEKLVLENIKSSLWRERINEVIEFALKTREK